VRKTFEETEAHYLPTIEGTDPTQHYLALLDGEPLGMIQTYLVSDYPDYAALIEEGEGTAGLDLFIGDEAMTGRGLGTEMIRGFTRIVSGGRRRLRGDPTSETSPRYERRESRLPGRRVRRPGITSCTRSSGATGTSGGCYPVARPGALGGRPLPLPRSARPRTTPFPSILSCRSTPGS
jgi:hypothetical protein